MEKKAEGKPGKHIVIVDDEPSIRKSFSAVFTRAGWSVTTAESAEEALERMAEFPPQICLLDLHLPGMDGVELCRRIRTRWPMAICQAVTGYTSFFELLECREAGFEDYFTKPVELATLLEATEQARNRLARWRGPE